MDLNKSFSNLYKKIDVTSKTRFNASRRLKRHAMYSTYTVVFMSLSLIFISLLQAYSLGINITSKYTGFIQIFAAIVVLVYSLLIDKNEYSSIAGKMYSCASRLGELKQEIHPYKDVQFQTKEAYDDFKKRYWSILDLYETHLVNDFPADNLSARLEMPEDYKFGKINKWYLKAKIYWMEVVDMSQYLIVNVPLLLAVKWLWLG